MAMRKIVMRFTGKSSLMMANPQSVGCRCGWGRRRTDDAKRGGALRRKAQRTTVGATGTETR